MKRLKLLHIKVTSCSNTGWKMQVCWSGSYLGFDV
jgi:hypothetical protein